MSESQSFVKLFLARRLTLTKYERVLRSVARAEFAFDNLSDLCIYKQRQPRTTS